MLTDAEALGEPWESVGVHGSKGEAEKQARDIQGAVTRVGRKWHAMRRFEPKPGGGASRIPEAQSAALSDPVRDSLSPAAQAAYDMMSAGTPEERAQRARLVAGDKPKAELKPGAESKTKTSPAPKTSARTASAGPPDSAHASRKELADAVGRGMDGDSDPMKLRAAGFPAGHDRAAFHDSVAAAVSAWHDANGYGMQFDEAYKQFGGGMGKREFVRALVDAHDADTVRVGGWGRTVGEIPDPELAGVLGENTVYNLYPSDRPKAKTAGVSVSDLADLGRSLPDWAGHAHDPGAPHVGHKVFISDLHERLAPGMSLDEFKDHLEQSHPHALSRIDMSELASDPDKLDASETRRGSHVVDVTRLR